MTECLLCLVLFLLSACVGVPFIGIAILIEKKSKNILLYFALFVCVVIGILIYFPLNKYSRLYGVTWFFGSVLSIIFSLHSIIKEYFSDYLPTFADIIISVFQGLIVIAGSSVLWCLLSFLEDLQWFIKLTIIVSHTIYLETPLQLIDVLTFIPVMVWNYKYNLKTAPYGIFEKFYYCSIQYIWVIVARFLWFDEFSVLVTLSPIVPFILCIRNLVKECCKQKNKKGYT